VLALGVPALVVAPVLVLVRAVSECREERLICRRCSMSCTCGCSFRSFSAASRMPAGNSGNRKRARRTLMSPCPCGGESARLAAAAPLRAPRALAAAPGASPAGSCAGSA